MKLVSVNVGLPREVPWRNEVVRTAIFKEPVEGRVRVQRLHLEGDGQADLRVHGGPTKAVYAYPSQHYAFWAKQLPRVPLLWGHFGENLTTEGMREDAVHIGDRFRIGSAELVVTEPRQPCFKLGLRFGDPGMVKRFLKAGRSGFYFSVAREGELAQGDPIELLAEDEHRISVADIVRLLGPDRNNADLLRRASELPALPEPLREHFRHRLAKA